MRVLIYFSPLFTPPYGDYKSHARKEAYVLVDSILLLNVFALPERARDCYVERLDY